MDHALVAAAGQTKTVIIGLVCGSTQQHNRITGLTPGQSNTLSMSATMPTMPTTGVG